MTAWTLGLASITAIGFASWLNGSAYATGWQKRRGKLSGVMSQRPHSSVISRTRKGKAMPFKVYSEAELNAAIRLAWATGVRDCLELGTGQKLDDEEVRRLAGMVNGPNKLRGVVRGVAANAYGMAMRHDWPTQLLGTWSAGQAENEAEPERS